MTSDDNDKIIGSSRATRSQNLSRRRRDKREYQQRYRDKRQGRPEKRLIGSALLEAALNMNEDRRLWGSVDRLFDRVFDKLKVRYTPEILREAISTLLNREYKDYKIRKERHFDN